MSLKPNNAMIIDACTQRVNALQAHVAPLNATIPMNGSRLTPTEAIAIYQACLDQRATLSTLRAEAKAALGALAAADDKRLAFEQALKGWVVHQFGIGSKEAHDFGFPPPRPPARSVKSKATALERSEATRLARHTMGPRQKEGVKGTKVVLVAPANPESAAP